MSEELIACCGLYCGDCHGFKGNIPDLARDLRKELRAAKYSKFAGFLSQYNFAKGFEDYDKCYEVLGLMVKFRCKKSCHSGGGSPFCKIRKCCDSKGLEGCWQCESYKDCEKLAFLEPVHGKGHIKNLTRIKKKGKKAFVKGKHDW